MSGSNRLEHAALSHEGRVRKNNEDAFCVRAEDGLFLVADGMGGHENGEWASAAIADQLRDVALPGDFEEASHAVAAAMHRANAVIFAEAQARGLQMGSTAVALLIRGREFAVLWVGDSRCYLHRDGQLVRMSHDHTQVQDMIDRGLLTPEEGEGHPMSHVLARAMGVRETVEVDVIADEIESGDVFLLCSDGLMARVEDDEIEKVLTEPDAAARAQRLIKLTLDRGAPDNVTVITVGIPQTTLLQLNQPIHVVAP
ncbi:PP2C family protein-serine/threonine phosphatase [Sphingomonas sp.]|uniref:PP2C family protein-serine/threonine phosphatase n=1 Tax=Sphingomonas sp. TaxID=28214 RepID=UPI003B00B34F